ncbi:DUF4397 domain-containing protein [Halorussus amylolyticus]|uniref:DUF4397 domain-containing protein n=1 Tax=Halorussus amylolyticus TaxID=1126242 RepID=UPI001053D01C|nr:DUF4397 domain-containing protein [Halorussus amylolyticus]
MTANQSRRTVLKALGVAGSAALVGGSATGSVVAADKQAYVRVAHASPDAPAVDVFVNGNAVLEGVEFGTISDYLELDPGEYTFEVAPAGEGRDAAVLQASASVNAGTFYTVAAIGTLDQIDAAVLTDNTTRLRAVHFAPDAPAVDVAVVDGPTLFEGLEFGDASGYREVNAGTYDLAVQVSESGDTVATFEGVTLAPSTTYSAFALGTVADDDAPFTVELVCDEA